MTGPWAIQNGEFRPASQVGVALNDAGFVFGATVTDLCRTIHHRPYLLAEHLNRFIAGCSYARIPLPYEKSQLETWTNTLVARNAALIAGDQELAVVFLATPGPIGFYLGEPGGVGDSGSSFFLHTFPIPFSRYRSVIAEGARLAIPNLRAVPGACIDPQRKVRSRMHWYLAEQEIRVSHPGCQALLLDLEGNVTETATSNFLLVDGNTLVSPPVANILDGISLAKVRGFAHQLGYRFESRALSLDECHEATEALLTNSVYGVAGVREIQGRSLPWPGSVFQKLRDAWNREVGLDLHEQILRGR